MRKSFLLVIGLFVLAASLAAQTHDNMKEKAVKDSIVFSEAVRVGTVMLTPGEYRIACDRETITFTRASDAKKVVEMKCQGKDLGVKAPDTVAETNVDANGVRYLTKLLLHGSTIEHTFN